MKLEDVQDIFPNIDDVRYVDPDFHNFRLPRLRERATNHPVGEETDSGVEGGFVQLATSL